MKENEKIDTNSKVAIVTGGAKGIGAEIVRTLAENGYIVILNYNNSKVQAEELKNEMLQKGFNIEVVKAVSPQIDEILIIRPLFSFIIYFNTSCVQLKTEFKLTFIIFCHISSETSVNNPSRDIPALFTNISIFLNFFIATSIKLFTSLLFATLLLFLSLPK